VSDPFAQQSPYQKPGLARRQRLVTSITSGSIPFAVAVVALLTFFLLPEGSPSAIAGYALCVGIIPVSLMANKLARRGMPDQGSHLYLGYLLLLLCVNAIIVPQVYPVVIPGFILIIATSGMMLPPSQALILTVAAACLYLVARTFTGSIDGDLIPQPLADGFVIFVALAAFTFVAFINHLTTTDLRRALDEAIYDLVQANRKLKNASEMRSQFTARTSHELRTPLSSMIVFTDLALREAYGPINARLRKALTHALTSARLLRGIINDILDLSKIESGQLEITEDSFALSNLVEAVQASCGGIAQEKGVTFSVAVSPDMPAYLLGDEGRLAQILINLASNAAKFTDKGAVAVRLETHGHDRWRMVVHDTGPGVPEDQFETIFQAYRQLDSTSNGSKIKGTGLGLAISRHLARMMGGDVHVESELGKGSTFTVDLPLRVGHPVEAEAVPEPA
jgi:signal transduction histidine kinase